MTQDSTDVVCRLFEAYPAQDQAAACELVADELRFTSPQDAGMTVHPQYGTAPRPGARRGGGTR